jgi:hypothetical protein
MPGNHHRFAVIANRKLQIANSSGDGFLRKWRSVVPVAATSLSDKVFMLDEGLALPRETDVGSNRRLLSTQSKESTEAAGLQRPQIAVALVPSAPTLRYRIKSVSF